MNRIKAQNGDWTLGEDGSSASQIRGSYHPFHFCVRLRADIHKLLEKHPDDLFKGTQDFALVDAFSTYFHESLHWWQHIGSTTGLLLSLSPAIQSQVNYEGLRLILQKLGAQKPLRLFTQDPPGTRTPEIEQCLNRIVNNWYDLEFNRRILCDPKDIADVIHNPYFESQGHSLQIGLANLLLVMGTTFDSDFHCVPHPKEWETEIARLRSQKFEGYFFPSNVKVSPIGAIQIFEGQAMFSQLQYLFLATNGKMSWDELKQQKNMTGVYIEAFETFLRLTGLPWPSTPIHETVLLFLLICDLAINPSDGYPFHIQHFESLIISADPGIRFCWFCSQVAKKPQITNALKKCGREQYLEVASLLCKSLGCETPVGISTELMKWVACGKGFADLMAQNNNASFTDDNLPLRVCFAKHLRFAEQRLRRPDFFCWPAMYCNDGPHAEVNLAESLELFNNNQPPFIVHPNGEIRPALFSGVPEQNIYKTFNSFYYWILHYDLIDQWTLRSGPFDLDYTWMNPLYTHEFTKPWADKAFQNIFGVSLDDFTILG